MKVFVTGVCGQLGHDVVNELISRGHEAVGSDITEKNYGTDDGTAVTTASYEQLDITNKESVNEILNRIKPDAVVHCAAWTAVDAAEDEENKAKVYAINSDGTRNIAEACKKLDCKMIYISTDYVFGGNEGNTPRKENETVNPTGAYGRTKLHGEQAIWKVGCNYLIIRTAWLYSEFGNNFVKTMRKLTSERNKINVVFDQVGTPTYALDLANVIFKIIEERIYDDINGIYHFSNEGVISWYDFAKEICELSGNKCDIQPCHSDEFPSKVKRPSYSVLDKTKIKTTLNISIPYWKDSLKKCVNNI
jgi:dTDP-4-dehydrorhamnose reductase